MRFFIFILLIGFNTSVFSQDCFPISSKQKRILKKAKKYIADGKFYDATDLLESQDDLPIYLSLKTEISWLRGNDLFAETQGLSIIDLCPSDFSKVYYFLGDIYFKRKDYVNAEKFLQKKF